MNDGFDPHQRNSVPGGKQHCSQRAQFCDGNSLCRVCAQKSSFSCACSVAQAPEESGSAATRDCTGGASHPSHSSRGRRKSQPFPRRAITAAPPPPSKTRSRRTQRQQKRARANRCLLPAHQMAQGAAARTGDEEAHVFAAMAALDAASTRLEEAAAAAAAVSAASQAANRAIKTAGRRRRLRRRRPAATTPGRHAWRRGHPPFQQFEVNPGPTYCVRHLCAVFGGERGVGAGLLAAQTPVHSLQHGD